MRRAALAALALCACVKPHAPESKEASPTQPSEGTQAATDGALHRVDANAERLESNPMAHTPPSDAAEIDRQIQRLLAPSGDPQYRLARGEALEWLLAHADDSYPKLLALVDVAAPPVLAVSALPRFGRADSVPVLERVLRKADDPTTVVAGHALAEHPAPEARGALERALHDARDQVVASAADGLALRGDRAACPALAAALTHPNPDVRARLRAAAVRLDCNTP
jgi:HEAT repeat protein